MSVQTSDYVIKIRRDFSCILVPSRYFAPKFKRKKQNAVRAYDDFGYFTSGHAADCDCVDCLADRVPDLTPASNSSVNGYELRSRSRQAIRNAANSIFFRCDKKKRLRFITFTFPPLPANINLENKVDEDKYLHRLFKKFLDNERKNYGLKMWLWTNERQSGDRLEDHEKDAREVLHYHCIFDYENPINYYIVNLRFLRLLHRNDFNILSSHSLRLKKTSLDYPKLKAACRAIATGDYDYFLKENPTRKFEIDSERIYLRDNLGIKRFMFLCPVDFEKIRYSSLDIGQLSAYISKYIGKSSDKIYCRRWGCSHGLVISEEQLRNFVEDSFKREDVDADTGEIITSVDSNALFNFFTLGDKSARIIKFEVNITGDNPETLYYIPPNFLGWSHHSELRKKFMTYFNYNI